MMKNLNLKLPFMKNVTNFKIHNSAISIAVVFLMRKKLPFKVIDIKKTVKNFDHVGRFQKIINSPPIYVDVCHNNHAALELSIELKKLKIKYKKKIIAIFNIQKNKEYKKIFSTLNPVIDFWKVPIINDESLVFNNNLSNNLLNKKNISYGHKLENILKLALSQETDSLYIIFGSFAIVSATLRFLNYGRK
jgi:dihydrofolate synthase/folylpolyglutamate synthase